MEDAIFSMVAAERRRLADRLAKLTPAQWEAPSLCEGWRVRDVLAHLIWPLETSMVTIMAKLVLSGFSFDKVAAQAATADGRPPTAMLGVLRAKAESRFKPPGAGAQAPLTDVLVHGLDIRRPLGLDLDVDHRSLRASLDYLLTKSATRGFVKSGVTEGLRFDATDVDWSGGAGLRVTGRAEDLLLALTGRRSALGMLHGDGADEFRARLDRA